MTLKPGISTPPALNRGIWHSLGENSAAVGHLPRRHMNHGISALSHRRLVGDADYSYLEARRRNARTPRGRCVGWANVFQPKGANNASHNLPPRQPRENPTAGTRSPAGWTPWSPARPSPTPSRTQLGAKTARAAPPTAPSAARPSDPLTIPADTTTPFLRYWKMANAAPRLTPGRAHLILASTAFSEFDHRVYALMVDRAFRGLLGDCGWWFQRFGVRCTGGKDTTFTIKEVPQCSNTPMCAPINHHPGGSDALTKRRRSGYLTAGQRAVAVAGQRRSHPGWILARRRRRWGRWSTAWRI